MPSLNLPIWDAMKGILSALQQGKNVVVTAPPGSGKTTQVPQAIFQSNFAIHGMILVVQPRKVACRMAAQRVASELNVELGQEVGYIVRNEKRITPNTRICFLTDGMLLILLQQRVLRSNYGIVILDEVHERRMVGDLILGLLRHQQQQGSAIQIVAMSATVNAELVASRLDAEHISASGRLFPLTIRYARKNPRIRDLSVQVAECILEYCKETQVGDVLAFLPGKVEIQATEQELLRRGLRDTVVMQLHSQLPFEEQQQVFLPTTQRKIVLATNIAETSLTVPGITAVIDTGYERRVVYDDEIGTTRLVLHRISQASSDQRAGRSARVQPGVCFRLWSEELQDQLEQYTPPEIQRTDISSMLLNLRVLGIKTLEDFPFLEAPFQDQVASAERLLVLLGALDREGDITALGRRLLRFPLSPRHARMMVEAERLHCVKAMASVVSILDGPPLFTSVLPENIQTTLQEFTFETYSDLLAYVRILDQAELHLTDEAWFTQRALNRQSLIEMKGLREKILRIVLRTRSEVQDGGGSGDIVRCIASGLPDRYAKRLLNGRCVLLNGQEVTRDPLSVTRGKEVVAASIRIKSSHQDADAQKEVLLSLLTEVDFGLMQDLAPSLFPHAREKLVSGAQTGFDSVHERFGHLQGTVSRLLKK